MMVTITPPNFTMKTKHMKSKPNCIQFNCLSTFYHANNWNNIIIIYNIFLLVMLLLLESLCDAKNKTNLNKMEINVIRFFFAEFFYFIFYFQNLKQIPHNGNTRYTFRFSSKSLFCYCISFSHMKSVPI